MKALTVGFALQAGFGAVPGVEGLKAPETGLQLRGDNNLSKVPEQFMNSEQLVKQDHLTKPEKRAQILSAVLDQASADPRFARKVLETLKEKDRRKLAYGPDVPCFQWGIPNTVTAIGASVAGGGTAISVDYNINTLNTCKDTISNVEFVSTETITCPAGCAQSLITRDVNIQGVPSSIAQGIMSAGIQPETVYCERVDANGGKTPTVPTRMSLSVYPIGQQNGNTVQGLPEGFNVYP